MKNKTAYYGTVDTKFENAFMIFSVLLFRILDATGELNPQIVHFCGPWFLMSLQNMPHYYTSKVYADITY